jgi:ABC-type nitrate/sulfonate/bicarbonate transport system substrate-binding protein
VLLDGFDPIAQMKLPIDALPVFKSNEPNQLDKAGVKYKLFDPKASGIPGSFGILYSNAKFVNEHPTAAQDFVRATMKGLADAIADPPAAVATCFKLITDGGNPNYLSDAGEQYRWGVEAKIVTDNTPAGEPIGLVHVADLQKEIDAYTAAGVFTSAPSIAGTYDESILAGVYGPDGKVIWPAS